MHIIKKNMMNAFMNFSNQHRQEVMEGNPGAPVTKIPKILGSMWRSLCEEEKKKCKDYCSDESKSDESCCECEEDEDEEFHADLFADCTATGCPRVLNTMGSLSDQLGLQVNKVTLPDEAQNWRPT